MKLTPSCVRKFLFQLVWCFRSTQLNIPRIERMLHISWNQNFLTQPIVNFTWQASPAEGRAAAPKAPQRAGSARPAGAPPPAYGRRPYSPLTNPGGTGGIFKEIVKLTIGCVRKFCFQELPCFCSTQLNIIGWKEC